MTYTCEVCKTTFEGTPEEAFSEGWDTPEMFLSHCTCPNCTIEKTVWWKAVVEKQTLSDSEMDLLWEYNQIWKAANKDRTAQLENSDVVLQGTHLPSECMGEFCTIHNRSDHHMRSWPQQWRGDRGIMERVCEHGIGHPDPDEYKLQIDKYEGVHGCDGCCSEVTFTS